MSPRQTRRATLKVLQDVPDSNDVSVKLVSPKNRRTMKPKRGKSVKSPGGNASESPDTSMVRTRTKAVKIIVEDVDATPSSTSKARSRSRRNTEVALLQESISTPPPSTTSRLRRHANKTLLEESSFTSSTARSRSRKNVDRSVLEESLAAKGSPLATSSSRLRRNADSTLMHEVESVPEVDSKQKKAKSKKPAKSPKSRKLVEADTVLSTSATIEDEGNHEDQKISEAEQQVTTISDEIETLKSPPDKTSTNSSKKRKRGVSVVRSNVVTPQSSPIVVNLSPTRSTKTPRKSPVNLGSPKTHTKTPLRLSKTPRKLPISAVSPEIFDEWSSEEGVDSQSDTKTPPSNKRELDASTSIVQQTPSPNTSSKSRKSRPSPSKLIRIAAPQRKSSGKKSPGRNRSKGSKTPSPRKRTSKASVSPSKKSNPKKSPRGSSKKKLSLTPSARVKGKRNSLGNDSQAAAAETDTENITPNTKKVSPRGGKSPRRSRSTGERVIEESKSTPLRVTSLRNGSLSKTGTAEKNADVPPMLRSSTPRDRIRRSLNLSGMKLLSPNTSSDVRSLRRNDSTFTLTNSESDHSRIENESAPLLSESTFDVSNNGAFEKSRDGGSCNSTLKPESDTDQNVTYEVLEPKTPNLQRKGKKRTSLEADLSRQEHEAKRSCRVRFASPEIKLKRLSAKMLASNDEKVMGTPVNNSSVRGTPASKRKLSGLNNRVQMIANTSRRRSNSTNARGDNCSTPNNASIRRRSKSISDLSSKKNNSLSAKAQNESVLRLSRPRQSLLGEKKSEIKTPAARKIPNFKEIHQKNFARMESLVDAKKRLQERHLSFKASALSSASKANSTQKRKSSPRVAKRPAPPDASNYTKFGYKIRKTDAVNMISKKPLQQRDKKAEARQALKGVRSNRRFQLLMEARNLKL